ncbi:MAG: exonuclease domain-containing protein [Segniliparus sp.]|uniref:exonuclease domain-containing protein n=1 Tax=Segniliparus sp. TaxID=2804064 RepID=UPI003F328ACF
MKQSGSTPRETEFTVLDIETTAFSPPGRVIEVGAVRLRGDGHVVGEFSTLVHPGHGVDLGATWVHKIFPQHIQGAPVMREVIGDLLAFMDGSVLVAHNANFEERFLRHEFDLLGVSVQGQYSLCTLELSRMYFPQLPNHKLPTVAESFRLPNKPDHSALEDARVCAQLLATFLSHPYSLTLSKAPRIAALPTRPTALRPLQPRVSGLSKGNEGWLSSLMRRLPMSTPGTVLPDVAQRYSELLSDALADGRIVGDEAKQLGQFASQSGMSRADVQTVHISILDGMRTIAEADNFIDESEHHQLVHTAKLLGFPDHFNDLANRSSPPELVNDKEKPLPVGRKGNTRQGPWGDRRVLFLTVGERTVLLQEMLVERGAQIAKILTDTVTHIVADSSSTDSRIDRAHQRGLPVLTLLELQGWFLETTLATENPPPPTKSVQQSSPPQKTSTAASIPSPLTAPVTPAEHTPPPAIEYWPSPAVPHIHEIWHYPQPAKRAPEVTAHRASRMPWVWSILAAFPLLLGGFCCLGGFGAFLKHDTTGAIVVTILGTLFIALAVALVFLAIRSARGKTQPPHRP